ncbi:cystatin domain protein [Necator americanus]|uniref:Cystatin domain protein n=1 Tax=Necator americanus TaxID=51031 RepID=W2T036_NECAM|nr:cystatin domain protein [Necator americanus]ETN74626.1 cystatin domain protein [Necator americanus]
MSPPVFLLLWIVTFVDSQILSGGIGGPKPLNPSDPENMERAWKAVNAVNEKVNDEDQLMVPVKVEKAEAFVVAGRKYIFEILYGESTCKKGQTSTINSANCPLKPNGHQALYEVVLWEKLWENFEQYTVKKIRDVHA